VGIYTQIKSGPPRAGSGPGEKKFGASSKGGPAENLYTKSERLTVICSGLGLKGLICKSTNNNTTEKDRKICNTAGPREFVPASPSPLVGIIYILITNYNRHWKSLLNILIFILHRMYNVKEKMGSHVLKKTMALQLVKLFITLSKMPKHVALRKYFN
jgi:hypothetical protein